jgi:hypothetical protein
VLGSGTIVNTNDPGGMMLLSLKFVSVTSDIRGDRLVVNIVYVPGKAFGATEHVRDMTVYVPGGAGGSAVALNPPLVDIYPALAPAVLLNVTGNGGNVPLHGGKYWPAVIWSAGAIALGTSSQ